MPRVVRDDGPDAGDAPGGGMAVLLVRTLQVPGGFVPGRSGVRVQVHDTGVGIAPGDLARIFEPDFSTKTAGTGLGLALVRRTIDDLGGTIDVVSEEGRGTTFDLWLPGPERDTPRAR